MAVWKKLNPETGEYEEIPAASVSGGKIGQKDTIGVEDAYTTYLMDDIADTVSVGSSMTTYTVSGLIKGDTIATKRGYNGQGSIISRIIYGIVGLAGLWCVTMLFRRGRPMIDGE